jgi:hypothetical protein
MEEEAGGGCVADVWAHVRKEQSEKGSERAEKLHLTGETGSIHQSEESTGQQNENAMQSYQPPNQIGLARWGAFCWTTQGWRRHGEELEPRREKRAVAGACDAKFFLSG